MSRVDLVLDRIGDLGLDGLLLVQNERVTKKNVRYVAGFSGTTAYVLITPEKRILTTDDRYTVQAALECPGFEIVRHEKPWTVTLTKIVSELGIKRLGYETEGILVSFLNAATGALPGVELVPTTNLVEALRAIKDDKEIETLSTAAELADRLFDHIVRFIKPGVTEIEVATEYENYVRKLGAPGLAFGIIVASGERGAQQHGHPTEKKVQPGDFIVMDFGAIYEGYLSDMTRTVLVGKASDGQRRVYETVKRAQQAARDLILPGELGRDAARTAYDIMAGAGYGDHCSQNLGHGTGLEIHEEPFMTLKGDLVLEPGHVVTVEPGIYIPGWGGVRIEDMVLVEKAGQRVLTHSTRDLIEI